MKMYLYAFIATIIRQLVATVSPFYPLCTGVSQMNSLIVQPYPKTKLCIDMFHFCDIFLPIVAKIWLPWQLPLDPCNPKCFLWIDRPRKPPVISNRIMVISHRNAFMYIYSDFCPKVGYHGNAPLSRVYGSVTAKIPRWHKPHVKPKLCTDMLHTTKFMAIFVMFCLFWPNIGGHGNVP